MSNSQITVLDAGGQYCHLIARKVRDLGVHAEVRPSETPASELAGSRGLIISGGPSSVYEAGSPGIDPAILTMGIPVLGICYGLQLMANALGGVVRKGSVGEYGAARLSWVGVSPLFDGLEGLGSVWMSHRDRVDSAPPGFHVIASTETCPVAGMANSAGLMAVQFHPEVVHTAGGAGMLSNFVFKVCGTRRDWDPKDRIGPIEEQIRKTADGRGIFFFVSGGVDSTVAYTLCLRALGPERVYGIYVDTGLMRSGETDYVGDLFRKLGATAFHVEHAEAEFLGALAGVSEPERKRHIIGEQFVAVQERILNSGEFLNGNWVLGQGTIYPDTIESGGSAKADLIKTHHNRVAGIQKLIDAGRIVEPLASFYKDEVREIGARLGIPAEFLERHPFPGPGLAIRCLCSESEGVLERRTAGWVVPVKSVGVQGDSRSYRPVLLIEEGPSAGALARASGLTNEMAEINRVMARVDSRVAVAELGVTRGYLTGDRLERLRRADEVVRRRCAESGFESQVWQFPVVLIPVGRDGATDSVVLRPIHSVDGMTAEAVLIAPEVLGPMAAELLQIEGVAAVFYDLTHKPPGTIEWE